MMATQMRDGSWSATEPIDEAMQTFYDAILQGKARKFVVGTEREIEQEKEMDNMAERLFALQDRVDLLELKADPGLVVLPTKADLAKYGKPKD